MLGLMQDWPLLVHRMLDHGAFNHGEREIVTRSVEGPIRRCTLADLRSRSLRVAKALEREGIGRGDRVGTMAWNSERPRCRGPVAALLRHRDAAPDTLPGPVCRTS